MPGEKGSYRSIYSALWDDPEFQGFPAATQLVFLHLRTCPECNWPCIFPFYQSTLYERLQSVRTSDITKAWDTLCHPPSHPSSPWIIYERPLLWIVKGMKNEPSFSPTNPNHVSGVISLLRSLPKLGIINRFAEYYGLDLKVAVPGNGIGDAMGDGMGDGSPHAMGDQGTGTGTGKGTGKGRERVVHRANPARFTPPTLEQVVEYCKARGNQVDPVRFHAHYTAVDWMRGKNKIRNWKACVVTWESRP